MRSKTYNQLILVYIIFEVFILFSDSNNDIKFYKNNFYFIHIYRVNEFYMFGYNIFLKIINKRF